MKAKQVPKRKGFWVLTGNRRCQAAAMNIAPGDAEGGPQNRHRGADQWLFVLSGRGLAKLARGSMPLRAGSLLLIERGERHEVRNVGTTMLRTLNLYSPPAYTRHGDELPSGRP